MAFSSSVRLRFLFILLMVVTAVNMYAFSERHHRRQGTETVLDVETYMDLILKTPPSVNRFGSYLASRFAQSQFDWVRARDFLKAALEEEKSPPPPALSQRLMLLSMVTGDLETARAERKNAFTQEGDTGLSRQLEFVIAVRDEQWDGAHRALQEASSIAKSDDPVFQYARPLLSAWLEVRGKSLSRAAMVAIPSPHQRVLIAGYLGQVAHLIDPVAALAWAPKMTSLNAQEMGDIFMQAGMYDVAGVYYAQAEKQTGATDELEQRRKAAAARKIPDGLVLLSAPATPAQGIASVFFDIAANFYIENSIESAELFANLALALDPNLISARLMLGHLYAQNSRPDQAIEMFKTIPETSTRYAGVRRQIAALYVEQGNKEAAIDILTRQMDHVGAEDQIDLMVQIGDIYRDAENYGQAFSWYDRAMTDIAKIGRKPDAELLYARGVTLERLHKWPAAEIDLKAALALEPHHPYIMNYLGYSWADQGVNLDQALDLLQKANAQVPDDGAVTDSLGWTLYRMGRYTQAVEVLEQAAQLVPYDSTINDHLGDAYWKSGRRREARFEWQRAENYAEDEADKAKIRAKILDGMN